MSPHEIEREIAAGLAGARLVFELGIDETRYETVRSVVERLAHAGRRPEDLRRSVPALYATYLVFTGVYRYESGTLWTQVHPNLTQQGLDPGREFWRCLRALGLETFDLLVESERAQTWITRILAHGGIPVSCLDPFLDLLGREIAAGASDAADLLASWRTQHTRLTVLHQPTRRFLLYGGETAVDLLDRCLEVMRARARDDALPTASEAGLPQYFVDAVAAISRETLRRASRPARVAAPRPIVNLDPYSGLGPTAWLPAVPDEAARGGWRVDDGEQIGRYPASAVAGTSVRLVPARSYEVEFWGEDGGHRRYSFEGLERLPVLLLDPSTEQLLRDPVVVSLDEVWVLSPPGVTIRGRAGTDMVELRQVQELPAQSGAWSGWSLLHFDLEGVNSLELVQDGKVVRALTVLPPRLRPELEGPLVEGVTTADGAFVYAAPPRLRIPTLAGIDNPTWTIRVRGADTAAKFIAEPDEDGTVDVGEHAAFGRFTLTVRGPLGSDLSTAFAVVPDLEVRRPTGVVRPEHGEIEVTARSQSSSISGAEVGAWTQVVLEDDATLARFTVRRMDGETLELHAHVARLVWAILHDTKPAVRPAAKRLRVGAEEFDDQLADVLVVRTGATGTELALELHGAEGRLAGSGAVVAAGREGRWSFDLGPFSDLIRRSHEGRLSFHLLVNGWPVHVADIVARIEVSRWRATTRIADDFAEVIVAFDQERDVRGRVARLWPQHRPWEDPIEVPLEDGAREARFSGYGLLAPGPYLAEVAIADPWVTPRRPRDGGPTARTIVAGSREQIDEYLEALDPHDPRSHIIWALTGHVAEDPVEPESLLENAGDLAAAAHFSLVDTPRDMPSPAAFHRLASLLVRSDRLLCRALVSAAENDMIDVADAQRLSLRLLPRMDPTAEQLDETEAAALWRISPVIAACLDVPWASLDEQSAARCETYLGWTSADSAPEVGGGQVNQAFLAMTPDMLKEIRRTLGLLPSPMLDSCELQAATFEWLLAAPDFDEDDPVSPRNWFFKRWRLLREAFGAAPETFVEAIKNHLKARLPPTGTEKWAAIPGVTLSAAAHIVTGSRHATTALIALDEALAWAPRLVGHDAVLAIALLHEAKAMESR